MMFLYHVMLFVASRDLTIIFSKYFLKFCLAFCHCLSERDHLLVVLSGLIFHCGWALNLAGLENSIAGIFQSAERLSIEYYNPTYQYPVFLCCKQLTEASVPSSGCPLKRRKNLIKTTPILQRNLRLQLVSFFFFFNSSFFKHISFFFFL